MEVREEVFLDVEDPRACGSENECVVLEKIVNLEKGMVVHMSPIDGTLLSQRTVEWKTMVQNQLSSVFEELRNPCLESSVQLDDGGSRLL